MEGIVSVLQLLNPNLKTICQIRFVKLWIQNPGIDQKVGSNNNLQRRLVLGKLCRTRLPEYKIAAMDIQYPVTDFEPLLRLPLDRLSRLGSNIRDSGRGDSAVHLPNRHLPSMFIKPNPGPGNDEIMGIMG